MREMFFSYVGFVSNNQSLLLYWMLAPTITQNVLMAVTWLAVLHYWSQLVFLEWNLAGS